MGPGEVTDIKIAMKKVAIAKIGKAAQQHVISNRRFQIGSAKAFPPISFVEGEFFCDEVTG
jgi:hypothetical protein